MSRQINGKRKNQRKAAPSVRRVTFDEMCEQLNQNIEELGGIEEAESQLAIFEKNEKEHQCHLTDELMHLRFIVYASLKRYPPDFVLSNYGFHQGRFRNFILQHFGAMRIIKK